MKISAQMSIIFSAIFSVVCFGVAVTGYSSMGEITDPVQLSDAKGFAMFWAFLGTVGLVFGALGVWIVRTHKESDG